MSVRAFFFDVDGTLVDSNEFHVEAWHEAFSRQGVEISHAVIRKQIGKGGDVLLPALLPDSSESVRKAIDSEHGEIFKSQYLHRVKPFEGATDLIKALHGKGIPIVLASSAKKEELQHYIGLLRIDEYLSGTVTSDDVDRSKPAGDIFRVALQRVSSVNPGQALAVGDTIYDVESAGKVGVSSAAVRTGAFDEEELKQAGALAVYENVGSIGANLDQVLSLR